MALVVIVTVPGDKAQTLAKVLVESKVCACANIISGVKSLFWWQGKIDSADESILLLKTKNNLFGKLKKLIKENHPYEVPEIIAFKIAKGNKEYLAWIKESCSKQK